MVQVEFGITQPAVSQHLRVLARQRLRDRPTGGRPALYAVDAGPFREVDAWLEHFQQFWTQRLDSLETGSARGRRERRLAATAITDAPTTTKESVP